MRKLRKNLTVQELVRLVKVQVKRMEASAKHAEFLITELESRVGRPNAVGLPKGWNR